MVGFFYLPMIDLKDIWIGDKVRLISNGEIGIFNGISEGKAIIILHGKKELIPGDNLSLVEDTPEEEEILFEPIEKKALSFHNIPTSIDLHIEQLAPEMKNDNPITILSYQLRKLDEYVSTAETAGLKYITIIHGKGTGVLKKEVEHFLKGREKVKFLIEVHDGGALEVHLI